MRQTESGQPSLIEPGFELPQPFLRLPFSASDGAAAGLCNVTEGWFYGHKRPIYGDDVHRGIDFDFPYGTEVFAPADGWAMRTYSSWLVPLIRQGRQIGHGPGLLVLMLHKVPGTDAYWWTKMTHLSDVNRRLHYVRPRQARNGDWYGPRGGIFSAKRGLRRPDVDLAAQFTPVKAGELLGRVGDTGLEWGWRDAFNPTDGVVFPRHRKRSPPWHPPHLHFEVYRRQDGSPPQRWLLDTKLLHADPFGVYGQVRRWEGYSPYDGYPLKPGHLWLNYGGRIAYAA